MSKFYFVLSITILYISATAGAMRVPNADEVLKSDIFKRSVIRNIDEKIDFIFGHMSNSNRQNQCFVQFVKNKINNLNDTLYEKLVNSWWLCNKYQNFLNDEALDMSSIEKSDAILSKAREIKGYASEFLNQNDVGTLSRAMEDETYEEDIITNIIIKLKTSIKDTFKNDLNNHIKSYPCHAVDNTSCCSERE